MAKILFVLSLFIVACYGHGRVQEPPNRGYLWRLPEYQWANPGHIGDDTELHCGGEGITDPNINACGFCGDPITQARPRQHEIGGAHERGLIVRNYTVGQTIDVQIYWQALHGGWNEFRLCDYSGKGAESETCFRENLLRFSNGETRLWDIDDATGDGGITHLQVQLPQGLRCDRCVMQWEWSADNGQFYRNCMDISIH
ncbi:uncharacterized protein LOC110860172 [Folsomia candida]|uniref:Chitin-binding type-4 domain-containing protein n=1 Tax=Folsomia candida TaxID=158441 RepID=A0A226DAV3_FOLCA|nr:uncharacterized protein LOC110860172 [Folsomia candida]OXA41386.1 hypothetical protein Fcan01_23659 [Folsomia candida]